MGYELFEELTGNKIGDYASLKEIRIDLKKVGACLGNRYEAISNTGKIAIFTGHIQRGILRKYN